MIGFASWIAAGVIAFALGRAVRALRPPMMWLELSIALFISVVAGMAATALDFGGWNELDPRAAGFAFFVSLAAIGLLRLAAFVKSRPLSS